MKSSKSRAIPTERTTSVQESDEDIVTARSSDEFKELNNSSMAPPVEPSKICNDRGSNEKQRVTMTSYHHDNYVDLYAGRTLDNSANKKVIESCSGRKQEDTEVLKQKYLNSEIRDLPAKKKNAFHHRRLLKTRSSHYNSGSPDIKNHINKMRVRVGLKTGNSCENLAPNQEYRCRKLKEFRVPTHILKRSMAELLYGDNNDDDADTEIAALFENYVEECENLAKSKTESNTEQTVQESVDSFLNGSVQAFLRGFLEEMQRDNASAECPADNDKQLNGKKSKPICDSDRKPMSQRDLISSKQDVTHKHLRLWEMETRERTQTTPAKIQMTQGELVGINNRVPNIDSRLEYTEEIENLHTNTPEVTGDKSDATTEIAPTSCHDERVYERSGVEDNGQVKRLVEQKIFSPQMREKSLNQHKYKTANLSNLCDEDLSIVRLAKQKLERRLKASFALEEAYLNKLKRRCISSDLKSGIRLERNDNKGQSKTNDGRLSGQKLYGNQLDEVEGWGTSERSYDEHDNIESSEQLHSPFPTLSHHFGVPMWSPSSSTPLYSPIDNKTSISIQPSTVVTPDITFDFDNATNKHTPTDTYFTGSRNDYSDDPNDITNTSKSFKHQAGFSSDYKKAAKLIKLRLTKSNGIVGTDTSFVDKSFANVPLSPCINYNIENSVRSGVRVTTSINLSEKLAQQLRELSQNADKNRSKANDRNALASIKAAKQTTSSNETPELPTISGDGIEPKTSSEGSNAESMCNLPDITTPNEAETGTKARRNIPRQPGDIKDVGDRVASEELDLPAISVKSLASGASQDNELEAQKHDKCEHRFMYGGVAVRAGVCTSPYKFDKQDPRMLLLKAKPLPGLHSVCTSCGFISARQESPHSSDRTTNISRRKSECKLKETHKQCFGSHTEDTWKLDSGREESGGLPKVAVEKITKSSEQKETLPVQSTMSNLLLAPTSRKLNCEEMSIKFMDRNIKFRFQREDADDNSCKAGNEWLKNISTPTCREKFECPVTSETRIYKEDIKRCKVIDNRSNVSTPVASPYLDYCKHRAELRAARHDLIGRKLTGEYSDTRSSIEKQEQSVRKTKKFPIIPMKKVKEKIGKQSGPSHMYLKGRAEYQKRSDLYIRPSKPARLPEIKSEIFALSSDNVNNNVASFLSYED